MLKLLSICAMFIALAMAPASAQQEAILRKVEVTGAPVSDIVLAMSKPGAPPTTRQVAGGAPNPSDRRSARSRVRCSGENASSPESVRSPVCTFHIESKGDTSPGSPVAVFVTRKRRGVGNRPSDKAEWVDVGWSAMAEGCHWPTSHLGQKRRLLGAVSVPSNWSARPR